MVSKTMARCYVDSLQMLKTFVKDMQHSIREKECNWKKTSPSLQATNDQISTQTQRLDEPYPCQAWVSPLEKKDSPSGCSNQGKAAQNVSHGAHTGLFSGGNDLLNLAVHRTINSATHSSTQNQHQQISTVDGLPRDCSQRREPTDINADLSGSHQAGLGNGGSKMELPPQPVLNNQPNVLNASKMQECVPLKKRKQYFAVTEENPGFANKHIVSTENQMVSSDQSWPKRTLDNGIRPFIKQGEKTVAWSISGKNVAVVFPLALEDVECEGSSKNPTDVNEEHLKTRSVADEMYHQYTVLQSRTKETDLESCSTSCSVAKTHDGSPEMPTQYIPNSGFSARSRPECPIEVKDVSQQKESVYSVPLHSTSVCIRKESVQKLSQFSQCSTSNIHEDVTTTNKSNVSGSVSKLNTETEKWSLQRLHRLLWDMEERQKRSWKEVSSADLLSDILRLFWNGDFRALCEMAKSDHYANIMKEVKLYSGKRDSTILQERPKEELDHCAEDIQNVMQNPLPPTVVSESFNSSMLNPNEELSDSNKKHGDLPSQTMLQSTANFTHDEIRMEKNGNTKVTENEKTTLSTEVASEAFSQVQSPTLMTINEHNCRNIAELDVQRKDHSSDRDMVRPKKPKLKCLSKLPLTVSLDNCKNVSVNSAAGEEILEMEGENKTTINGVSLVMSSNEQSPAESDLHAHNLEKDQPTTETTLPLDEHIDADSKDDFVDRSFMKISVLSPETAKKMYFIEPNEEVKTIHKDVSVETCTIKTDRAIFDQFDQMHEDNTPTTTDMNQAEINIRNDDAQQLKTYCCLGKWFEVLGYESGMFCTCDKKASTVPSDVGMDYLDIMEVITDSDDLRKIANAVSMQQMDNPLRTSGQHANLSQDLSHVDLSSPLTTTDSVRHVKEQDKKTTDPEVQKVHKKERMVNLTLFGSSSVKRNRDGEWRSPKKRGLLGVRTFDTEHFPPETLNVKVNPPACLNDTDPNRRQAAKRRVLKSCQANVVPTQTFAEKKRSRKLQTAVESRTETEDISGIEISTFPTAFDAMKNFVSNQQHLQTHESEYPSPAEQQNNKSARRSKKKKHFAKRDLMKKRKLDSISLTRRQHEQNAHKGKQSASSVLLHSTFTGNKCKSSKSSKLDYKVLPETFSFKDGSILKKVHQSSDTACGQETEAEKPMKRALGNLGVWCVSPKKKGLKSLLPSGATGSASTFQAFKKRYEEKTVMHLKTS